MSKTPDHHGHNHDHSLRSKPGTYAHFVEELHRLNLVTGAERERLYQGLAAAHGPQARGSVATPSSWHLPGPSDQAALAARKAGLVRQGPQGLHIGCGPETVHWGYLSGASDPVARVASGAVVTIDTVSHEGLLSDQGEPSAFFTGRGIAPELVLADAVEIYAKVQHSGLGPHIVSGPIWIDDAMPGDVLAVHVLDATPRTPYGVNSARTGKGGLPDEFSLNRSIVIPFDLERNVAQFNERIEIPLAPFFGIMATGPARTMGRASSVPPGPYGGNIDLKDLTAGSTLYLPVHVPGALFMVGDGHAAQGDGEVNLTAIETSMTGTFRLELIKGKTLTWPRAETPTHWITIGLDADLNEAMRIAIRETVGFLVETQGLSREDAYALASIAVDFEVTQVVDQVKGIHAMIPKAIFR
jgi:acetamidase/formamidase